MIVYNLQKKNKQIDNIDDNKNVDKFGFVASPNLSNWARRSVLTPNTLKSTNLGAIGPKLVTWVKEKSLRESNITLSTYQYLQPELLNS